METVYEGAALEYRGAFFEASSHPEIAVGGGEDGL
jgi:hypothetical protein